MLPYFEKDRYLVLKRTRNGSVAGSLKQLSRPSDIGHTYSS
jgi:hypothetical protein